MTQAASSKLLGLFWLGFFGLAGGGWVAGWAQDNGLLHEFYPGITGTRVTSLTEHASFPDSPESLSILSVFETPVNVAERFGRRVQGLVVPPQTGDYHFWISSDNHSALYLSNDETPANKRLVAEIKGATSYRQWDKYDSQRSEPIRLVANEHYYVEALMKEQVNNDHLTVRWQLPDGTIEEPIPNSRLLITGLNPPVIVEHPETQRVVEGERATFTVKLASTWNTEFQWQRNEVDFEGATESTLAIERVTLADHNARWRVLVRNSQGTTVSEPARLSVARDTTAPTVTEVRQLNGPHSLILVFSEPLKPATALTLANYRIEPGVSVLGAQLSGSGERVILKLSELRPDTDYRLFVSNLQDLADIPNAIAPDTPREITWDLSAITPDYLVGKPEPPGPSARTTGLTVTEIHYHPPDLPDDRNLEFVELRNNELWEVDLTGYRLSGDIEYAFPPDTVLEAESYLVVAASPEAVIDHYSIQPVLGPWNGELSNRRGTIRLVHRNGAHLLDIEYEDRGSWPIDADGFGHTLVLSKPSFGEGNPEAWAASAFPGGSPLTEEPDPSQKFRSVSINEFLAHALPPSRDYLELYNYSERPVNLSGCYLTDGPDKEGYQIPEGTTIAPFGFLTWENEVLGFSLDSAGEWIALQAGDDRRVIDVIRYTGQAAQVSEGRYPDGGRYWSPLSAPSAGAANPTSARPEIVINEIMYHPPGPEEIGEFVELHNVTSRRIELNDWRLTGDIEWRFPEGSFIEAEGFVVVARDADYLKAQYDRLTDDNTFGDFEGSLSNRRATLTLTRPETVISIDDDGQTSQSVVRYTVDEVAYFDGGRWGEWSDGGGSSMELIDPRSDNRFASNWADSDETAKSSWTTIEHTGPLDHGRGSYDELHVLLLGKGECLVDDISVARVDHDNLIVNHDLENGLNSWIIQGNHIRSGWSEPGHGYQSERSLHLRATSGGDNGANRIETDLATANYRLNNRNQVTIRAKVRWLRGHPDILLRLRGNPLELSGRMPIPTNLGTPGAINSRRATNAGPVIVAVTHDPVLPQSNQNVEVRAQVFDPNGLSEVTLKYRTDRESSYQTTAMEYRGAGTYTATIRGRSRGNIIAFHIEATDGAEQSAATQFPARPWNQECLVRFADPEIDSDFGTYRVWLGNENLRTWQRQKILSNELIDVTFVYGDYRAAYNAKARFRGSPFIRPGYGSPASSQPTAMIVVFPEDNRFLGVNKINLDGLEQPGRDSTLQRERTSFWIADQMNLPFSYQRYIQFVVNGTRKGSVFTDSQHPSSEFVETWFPDQSEGDLFKIDDWFEFNDAVSREFNENAQLRPYRSEGELKLARYRWNWEKKPNNGLDDDHTRFFELVEALNESSSVQYERSVESLVDVEQWAGIFAVRHIVGDWDGYGYNRGKNASIYKPVDGKWKMMLWDLDFSLGGGSHGTSASMYEVNDPTVAKFYGHPSFRRAYLRTWQTAVDGPLTSERHTSMLNAVYNAFRANQVNATSPGGIRSWMRSRRNYLISQLEREDWEFEITTNSGTDFASETDTVELRGSAPIAVKTIRVNDVAYPIRWRNTRNWTIQVPLRSGENVLHVAGFDPAGKQTPENALTIRVTYSGDVPEPKDFLTITELMYRPHLEGAEFVEIMNASPTYTFDLHGYRLQGVDFRFDSSYLLSPNDYAVIVKDPEAFAEVHGATVPIAGQFNGNLSDRGETIVLAAETGIQDQLEEIDRVRYGTGAPWPDLTDGAGSSLQLIETSRDNRRVANWTANVKLPAAPEPEELIAITERWRYRQTGVRQESDWHLPEFDDSHWDSGRALLYVESSELPEAKNTPLNLGQPIYYFRKTFQVEPLDGLKLLAYLIVDDGAILRLNGEEIFRLRMDDSPDPVYSSETVTDAVLAGPFELPTSQLKSGENVLAVSVHQTNAGSSDIVFGMSLHPEYPTAETATPGRPNVALREIKPLPPLWLNEIYPLPLGLIDLDSPDTTPWAEIYNSGSETIELADYYLSDDYTQPRKWSFPPGASIPAGAYRLIYCDGTDSAAAGRWSTNFRLTGTTGSALLSRHSDSGTDIVDYLNFESLRPYRSYGAFPDGSPDRRRIFLTTSPAQPNQDQVPNVPVFINEWMADNTAFMADPSDQAFDDWFELYNAGENSVDLSGFLLSDDPALTVVSPLPPGTVIAPKSWLVIWADGTDPSGTDVPGIHVDFRLSQQGETLSLLTPDGTLVDQVQFAAQRPDGSGGRLPDGSGNSIGNLTTPSPGAANLAGPLDNHPPVPLPVPELSVAEDELFAFTVNAVDPDGAASDLRFQFSERSLSNAQIDPFTGRITWHPTEQNGPGLYFLEVTVVDAGNPPQSSTARFELYVREINRAPALENVRDRQLSPNSQLNVRLQASDPDYPPQNLRYALTGPAPAGCRIDANSGLLTWSPSPDFETGTVTLAVSVTDDGQPPLSTTQTFQVEILAPSKSIRLTLLTNTGENLAFEWLTLPDVRYLIESSEALPFASDPAENPWKAVEIIEGDGTRIKYTETIPREGNRFYRVRQLTD